MFVAIADNLVRNLSLVSISVPSVQGSVDQGREQHEGSDEIDDFHGKSLFRKTRRRNEGSRMNLVLTLALFPEGASHVKRRAGHHSRREPSGTASG
jgi:hypothetical protein